MLHFTLKNSPLALAIGHIGFSYAPELSNAGEGLRKPFKALGLPIAEPRNDVHVQFSGPAPGMKITAPQMQHNVSWLFTSPDRNRGVSVGPNYLGLIVRNYQDFAEFSLWIGQVIAAIDSAFSDLYFSGATLRYFNVFKPEEIPSDWIVESARGIPLTGISTNHFHHRYEFWCETSDGALHARCTLEHGGSVPQHLQFAVPYIPSKVFVRGSRSHIPPGHL